jgi:hypothetical protein
LWYEYDWAGSEKEFRRAIALNANYAFAHDQFALSLALQARTDESSAESRRAAELDPLSPQIPSAYDVRIEPNSVKHVGPPPSKCHRTHQVYINVFDLDFSELLARLKGLVSEDSLLPVEKQSNTDV